MVTGSAKQVTTQLQDLATRYGFTGFNFLIQNPDDLRPVAEEVIPLLRPQS